MEGAGTASSLESALAHLHGDGLRYTRNLLQDWYTYLRHYVGITPAAADQSRGNVERLLRHADVAPWELTPDHVTRFFEDRLTQREGKPLAPTTVAAYATAWRGLQNYMFDAPRLNEIARQFNCRPQEFVTRENTIAVKRAKANWKPRSAVLNEAEIDAMNRAFQDMIAQAEGTKSFLGLKRDWVMFNTGIHFAMRVSELCTCRLSDFRASQDPRLARFGQFGMLTITGKNDVTGSVPMREDAIHQLLTWYLEHVRPSALMGRNRTGDGVARFKRHGRVVKEAPLSDAVFISERGGFASPEQFRKTLKKVAAVAGINVRRITPHALRHSGCTLMVPLYTPEVAQKYMRHKNLFTTLGYYHPSHLDAGNAPNTAYAFEIEGEEDEEDDDGW